MMSPEIEAAVRRVAPTFGLSFPDLAALVAVESNGKPFEAADPGTPTFLYERHKAYKFCPPASLKEALRQGVARKSWAPKTQYKDQGKSASKLDLLALAVDIMGAEPAYRSCSWGLFQIMGFNCGAAGYGSAVAMVKGFMTVDGQIEGACRFIASKGIIPHLKAGRWAKVAFLYNGEGYAENQYDTKLASAHSHYLKAEGSKVITSPVEKKEVPANVPHVPDQKQAEPVQQHQPGKPSQRRPDLPGQANPVRGGSSPEGRGSGA